MQRVLPSLGGQSERWRAPILPNNVPCPGTAGAGGSQSPEREAATEEATGALDKEALGIKCDHAVLQLQQCQDPNDYPRHEHQTRARPKQLLKTIVSQCYPWSISRQTWVSTRRRDSIVAPLSSQSHIDVVGSLDLDLRAEKSQLVSKRWLGTCTRSARHTHPCRWRFSTRDSYNDDVLIRDGVAGERDHMQSRAPYCRLPVVPEHSAGFAACSAQVLEPALFTGLASQRRVVAAISGCHLSFTRTPASCCPSRASYSSPPWWGSTSASLLFFPGRLRGGRLSTSLTWSRSGIVGWSDGQSCLSASIVPQVLVIVEHLQQGPGVGDMSKPLLRHESIDLLPSRSICPLITPIATTRAPAGTSRLPRSLGP